MSGLITFSVWFLLLLLITLLTLTAARLSMSSVSGRSKGPRSLKSPVLQAALAIVLVVALALISRIEVLAKADASVVRRLAEVREPTLVNIFTYVTTMGDVVPSLLIAVVLAVTFYIRTDLLVGWLLPVLVMVQIAIQLSLSSALDPTTIGDIHPEVVVNGGVGSIPSGGVARLFTILVVAGMLWARHNASLARTYQALAVVLVLVEATTRLYLGRHLMMDIVGGLLQGVALAIVGIFLLHLDDRRRPPVEASR